MTDHTDEPFAWAPDEVREAIMEYSAARKLYGGSAAAADLAELFDIEMTYIPSVEAAKADCHDAWIHLGAVLRKYIGDQP